MADDPIWKERDQQSDISLDESSDFFKPSLSFSSDPPERPFRPLWRRIRDERFAEDTDQVLYGWSGIKFNETKELDKLKRQDYLTMSQHDPTYSGVREGAVLGDPRSKEERRGRKTRDRSSPNPLHHANNRRPENSANEENFEEGVTADRCNNSFSNRHLLSQGLYYRTVALCSNNTRGYLDKVAIVRRHPNANEVAIRVVYCGLTRYDLQHLRAEWPQKFEYPLIPGLEIVGLVEGVGSNVTGGITVGTRVGVVPIHNNQSLGADPTSDLAVAECMGGGMSARVTVPKERVVSIPKEIPLCKAAPLLFSAASVFHALYRFRHDWIDAGASSPSPSSSSPSSIHFHHAAQTRVPLIGVIGYGTLGHVAVRVARAFGYRVVVFTASDYKTRLLRREGIEHCRLNVWPVPLYQRESDEDGEDADFDKGDLHEKFHGRLESGTGQKKFETFISNFTRSTGSYKGQIDAMLHTWPMDHDINRLFKLLRENGKFYLLGRPRSTLTMQPSTLSNKGWSVQPLLGCSNMRVVVERFIQLAKNDSSVLPNIRIVHPRDVNVEALRCLNDTRRPPSCSVVWIYPALQNAFQDGLNITFPDRRDEAARSVFSGLNGHFEAKVTPTYADMRAWTFLVRSKSSEDEQKEDEFRYYPTQSEEEDMDNTVEGVQKMVSVPIEMLQAQKAQREELARRRAEEAKKQRKAGILTTIGMKGRTIS